MKERPILFSGPMVRAILSGRKTQTRRIVKPQPDESGLSKKDGAEYWEDASGRKYICPFGVPGDRLWVRETWRTTKSLEHLAPRNIASGAPLEYMADRCLTPGGGRLEYRGKARPSIFMPRWASRINLEVADVRIERLNDITEEDAKAEGWDGYISYMPQPHPAIAEFSRLWESIHGPGSWDHNPWVWVVTFKVEGPE